MNRYELISLTITKLTILFEVLVNIFVFALLYYYFMFMLLFIVNIFKMRKILYSLLFLIHVYIHCCTPVYMTNPLNKKEIHIGNYYICNLRDYAEDTCNLNYTPNKVVKLLCPVVPDSPNTFNSDYCFESDGVKDGYAIKDNNKSIFTTIPGIIITSKIINNVHNITITPPFYVLNNISIICMCDSINTREESKAYLKINISRTEQTHSTLNSLVKGCDFGSNLGENQFLTKSSNEDDFFMCNINAYPGDIIGLNCSNFYNKNYDDKTRIEPKNCFSTVYLGVDKHSYNAVSITSLLPGAKYYPDLSSTPKDKNFRYFGTTYLMIPDVIDSKFTIYCSCLYRTHVSVAVYELIPRFNGNNILNR
ncbi:6-cysteine protein, putative [Hepatocystis sp. ex Piliocolobus tephrosceles]|nr:6-cysteine protein, putative [Hepatocystis sp. ex Piliocolobus tephrosceles]